MLVTKKFAVVFCCAVLFLSVHVRAEGVFGGKTIGQRLDDFNRTIFGADDSDEKAQAKTQSAQKANSTGESESANPRSGSIIKPSVQAKENANNPASPSVTSANHGDKYVPAPSSAPKYTVAAVPKKTTTQPYRPATPDDSILEPEETSDAPTTKPRQPTDDSKQSNVGAGQVVTPNNSAQRQAQVNEFGPPPSQPIQNRLMQSRNSAFKNPTVEQPKADPGEVSSNADRQAAIANAPAPRAAVQPSGNQPKTTGQPTPAKRPSVSNSTEPRPMMAQRPQPNLQTDGGSMGPKPSADPVAKSPRAATSATPAKEKNDDLLSTRRGPVLSVETLGPRKIIIGKESTYEVLLANSGDVAAEELIVFVSLPEWAEVTHAEAAVGTPQFTTPGQSSAPFQWKVGRLEARSKEKLSLRIIPRQSRPFDLAVRWDYKPVTSQTMIEVQEPKLEMQLEGPRDVFFGKKETYRLKLKNTGTGDAENVVVKLMPIGPGENIPATYPLGLLPAGESKSIEIELTARQAGDLSIQVDAKGDAGLHAELAEKVLVRRAGLEVSAEGPKLQFVNSASTYLIHVRNPGNAPAMNIRFTVALPAGMKYLGGIEGARTDATGTKLQWVMDSLNPQLEQVFSLKCRLSSVGTARVEINAVAEDELSTTAGVSTQVDSAASLSLDVLDPPGPISIGEETIYEVRVRNRGTKDAENVEVLGYFSKGIEPTGAEGGPNRIGPGQVAFAPLASLAPGAETVFKIRAKAETAGNHVFRAEVHCKAMGTRLVSEKNTLYYQDSITQDEPAVNSPLEANRTVTPMENYRTQRR